MVPCYYSASSINIRATDNVSQHNMEKDFVASFPSTASAPELHAVDSSDAVKEFGSASQPLVSSGVVERIGSSFLESSLSTRDALDKYQIVAQKLGHHFQTPGIVFQLKMLKTIQILQEVSQIQKHRLGLQSHHVMRILMCKVMMLMT